MYADCFVNMHIFIAALKSTSQVMHMIIATTNQIINVIKKFIVALCFYIILHIYSKLYCNSSMLCFQRTLAQIMTSTRKPHTRIACQTKQAEKFNQNTDQVVRKSGRGIRVNNKRCQSPKIIPIEPSSSNGIILPRP